MRNYLYIWNNKKNKSIIASGLEFRDFLKIFGNKGGLILLKHRYDNTEYDNNSRFDYIKNDMIFELVKDSIYNYGDFVLVDYENSFPNLSDKTISELLFFAHMGKPYKSILIPELNNAFLYNSHDDGWFLRLYYSSWEMAEEALEKILLDHQKQIIKDIKLTENAFWIEDGKINKEISTFNIDSILNRKIMLPKI
jgi:hypothetical protein